MCAMWAKSSAVHRCNCAVTGEYSGSASDESYSSAVNQTSGCASPIDRKLPRRARRDSSSSSMKISYGILWSLTAVSAFRCNINIRQRLPSRKAQTHASTNRRGCSMMVDSAEEEAKKRMLARLNEGPVSRRARDEPTRDAGPDVPKAMQRHEQEQ